MNASKRNSLPEPREPVAVGKRRPPPVPVTTNIETLVEDAFSDADSLREELQDWFDNLHENLQGGSKGEALQDAITALEGANKPDVLEWIKESEVTYTPMQLKPRASRADRLSACRDQLSAAADAIRAKAAELESLAQECEDAMQEWEAVEFPGMYG